MFKKFKKHRLSLFLLAMVAMLSVYYILMPEEGPAAPVDSTPDGFIRYQQFGQMRLEIIDERNSQVAVYEEKITQATVSLTEVENYILEINSLTELTEKEVFLESVIIDMGFEDSLVYLEESVLTISVLAEKFSVEEYVEIATVAKEEFGEKTLVVVNFINSSS